MLFKALEYDDYKSFRHLTLDDNAMSYDPEKENLTIPESEQLVTAKALNIFGQNLEKKTNLKFSTGKRLRARIRVLEAEVAEFQSSESARLYGLTIYGLRRF